jgi:glyoxylase-like metal-dependent hydrolase (beta-lactamase superfamily II)
MEIAPKVHLIPDIVANPYLIVEPDGLTLIDAGLPGSHRKILNYLRSLGFAPKALKRIIITHADFDHVGGLAALKKATGARVFAHTIEARGMAERHSTRPIRPRNAPGRLFFALLDKLAKPGAVVADELLKDGQTFPVLGGLQVLETPGHTPGHISLYSPSTGILFCGDSLVSEKTGLRGSTGANNWDQALSDAAVRRQAALGARIVCSGHGAIVKEATDKFPRV